MNNIFHLIKNVESAYKGKGIFDFKNRKNSIKYLLFLIIWIISCIVLALSILNAIFFVAALIFYFICFGIFIHINHSIQREENFFFETGINKLSEENWYDGFMKRLARNNVTSEDFRYIIKFYEEKLNHETRIDYIKFYNFFSIFVFPIILSLIDNSNEVKSTILSYSIIACMFVPIFSYLISFSINQKKEISKKIIYLLKIALLNKDYCENTNK